MQHAALLVERGHRLGACVLAHAGGDEPDGQRPSAGSRPEHRADEVAAIVSFADDPAGAVTVEEIDGASRPLVGRHPAGCVLQHVATEVVVSSGDPGDDYSGLVAVRPGGHCGVYRNDDAAEVRHGLRVSDPFATPQSALCLLQQLCEYLLSPGVRALVAPLDLSYEALRQEASVLVCGAAGHVYVVAVHKLAQHPDRPGCGRNHALRARAQAQAEGEVVPSLARVLPACELVAPCGVELRAS